MFISFRLGLCGGGMGLGWWWVGLGHGEVGFRVGWWEGGLRAQILNIQ